MPGPQFCSCTRFSGRLEQGTTELEKVPWKRYQALTYDLVCGHGADTDPPPPWKQPASCRKVISECPVPLESFRPELPGNLLLRLRALLGVNARCEVFEYLLVNRVGSPRAIASDCYYYPATISKTMGEMGRSGFLVSRAQGRRRLYSLTPDTWGGLFLNEGTRLTWVVWPRLFSALEQASSLRRLLTGGTISQLERSLPDFIFGDHAAHRAETLIPFFITRLTAVLESTS